MPHTIAPATTGRSKCRACGDPIGKGELRFGERLPNPFGDGDSETTHWYHPLCGAYRRPEAFAEILEGKGTQDPELDEIGDLAGAVAFGQAHPRVERINGVERSPSGRARCRQCREAIDKDTWRIAVVYLEEGMANPAGFIHATCASEYFETAKIIERLVHFGTDLSDDDVEQLRTALAATR